MVGRGGAGGHTEWFKVKPHSRSRSGIRTPTVRGAPLAPRTMSVTAGSGRTGTAQSEVSVSGTSVVSATGRISGSVRGACASGDGPRAAPGPSTRTASSVSGSVPSLVTTVRRRMTALPSFGAGSTPEPKALIDMRNSGPATTPRAGAGTSGAAAGPCQACPTSNPATSPPPRNHQRDTGTRPRGTRRVPDAGPAAASRSSTGTGSGTVDPGTVDPGTVDPGTLGSGTAAGASARSAVTPSA